MFLSACRRLKQKQKLLDLFCRRSRYVFANSNPLNAAVFSNLKNDSEVRNKNFPPPLKTLCMATVGKAK